MADPYKILGLPADSDDTAIRRRYLELVKKFQPEHHPEKFAAIRAAYESLRDLTTRVRHRLFEAGKADEKVLDDPEIRELINVALNRAKVPMPARARRKLIIKSISAKQRPRRSASE